jgi:hypothetical protein
MAIATCALVVQGNISHYVRASGYHKFENDIKKTLKGLVVVEPNKYGEETYVTVWGEAVRTERGERVRMSRDCVSLQRSYLRSKTICTLCDRNHR